VEIVEAHAGEALGALREEWDALLSRCERATIYQTWEWNEAWWRAFGARKRLRLLLVRDKGALIGLAPLYVSRHLGTPLRRLAFLGTGVTDYMDVLAPEERAPEVCSALLRYVVSSLHFDMADFQQMHPAAHLRETAARLSHEAPGTAALVEQEPCPAVALPATWEEYAARLGKKMRSNVSYYDRLLPKTFERAEIRLTETGELSAAMDALFELHQKRWNARLLPGVLGGQRVQAFHRLVAQRFQARGWLRLHVTQVEDRTVAALYCFRFRDRYYYYLGGFAPELSRYSLGTVLTAHAMRQAIGEGCATFDFLRGNEAYKYRWLPEDRMNCRLLLGRPRSLRSHAMLRLNRLERYVEHRAKEFAKGRGQKQ
jgi:CelD/BcsL family acetyltransferase involved in cellulose biosynthesis